MAWRSPPLSLFRRPRPPRHRPPRPCATAAAAAGGSPATSGAAGGCGAARAREAWPFKSLGAPDRAGRRLLRPELRLGPARVRGRALGRARGQRGPRKRSGGRRRGARSFKPVTRPRIEQPPIFFKSKSNPPPCNPQARPPLQPPLFKYWAHCKTAGGGVAVETKAWATLGGIVCTRVSTFALLLLCIGGEVQLYAGAWPPAGLPGIQLPRKAIDNGTHYTCQGHGAPAAADLNAKPAPPRPPLRAAHLRRW